MTTVRRQFPKVRELAPLVRIPTSLPGRHHRVSRAQSIDDLRLLAQHYAPRPVYDYVAGGGDEEITLERNAAAYRAISFAPTVLRDVATVDQGATVFGQAYAAPFGIAPVGLARAFHHEGEYAGINAAAHAGIPFTLSTMSSVGVDEVPLVSPPGARNWFQLYLWKDRGASLDLIARAADAGFSALVLTVDTPMTGHRVRDSRNGMTLPPSLGPGAVLDAVRHPRWLGNFLTTPAIEFANLPHRASGPVSAVVSATFDASVTFADLEWLRSAWDGPVVVKGVQRVDDAVALADLGADGLIVSTHGGRQLDRSNAAIDLLPPVVQAVGDRTTVMVDSGIMHGNDIVTALCLGARFTFVGKAYAYGLMAGGEHGVARAVDILVAQVHRAMALLGVRSLDDLGEHHVRALHAPEPPASLHSPAAH